MSETRRIHIFVDGSGSGHSAAHFSDNEVYYTFQKGATNNVAEYNGVILALEHLPDCAKATILSDSQLVICQLNGTYRCNYAHLNKKRLVIQDLITRKGLDIRFEWIPRELNKADADIRKHLGKEVIPGNAAMVTDENWKSLRAAHELEDFQRFEARVARQLEKTNQLLGRSEKAKRPKEKTTDND